MKKKTSSLEVSHCPQRGMDGLGRRSDGVTLNSLVLVVVSASSMVFKAGVVQQ